MSQALTEEAKNRNKALQVTNYLHNMHCERVERYMLSSGQARYQHYGVRTPYFFPEFGRRIDARCHVDQVNKRMTWIDFLYILRTPYSFRPAVSTQIDS